MASSMTPPRLSEMAYARDPIYRVCREPKQPDARLLVSRWREHTAKRDIVIGKDIPSRAFAKFLSHIMIVEPIDGDENGVVRLAGTAIRMRYGTETTGRKLSELYSPTVLPQYLAYLRDVRNTGKPLILEATFLQDDASPVAFDKIVLRAFSPDQIKTWNIAGVLLRNN